MPPAPDRSRSRLAAVLTGIFLLAIFMGAGPGLLLVNPDPSSGVPPARVLGLPILYAWLLLWFAVQAVVVAVAYRWLWRDDREAP